MTRLRYSLLSLFVITGIWINPILAGDIAACFKTRDMGGCNRQALSHVDFKSVVLEFVDPANTQLGEGLARLFWSEILQSISNVSGAGVILAYDREQQIETHLGQQNVQTFLHNNYHDAALKIAQFQQTQMAIWGAVLNDGEGIYVQNYLTLNEPKEKQWTTLQVNFVSGQQLAIPFMRKQFNLPEVVGSRTELFAHRFYTKCESNIDCNGKNALRTKPNKNSEIAFYVANGSQLNVLDMQGQWLLVQNTNQVNAWINIAQLEMHPNKVSFNKVSNVNLRIKPNQREIAKVNLDGQFLVLNVIKKPDYPWYLIDVNGQQGWVRSDLATNRSYIFPAVHLIAGFYRYNAQQYAKAIDEFTEYLKVIPEEDNVTRASVFKLLAASELAGNDTHALGFYRANEYLKQAAEYTPYDASVYSQQALLTIAKSNEFTLALSLLDNAYQLNANDPALKMIIEFLSQLERKNLLNKVVPQQQIQATRDKLQMWTS
jgi:SH3-like domain-containing protein